MSKQNWKRYKEAQKRMKEKIRAGDIGATPPDRGIADDGSLAQVLVEAWRIGKRIGRIDGLSEHATKSLLYGAERIIAICGEHGYSVVDNTGERYNDNMNGLDIVSVEFTAADLPICIKEVLEPIILRNQTLFRRGKAILAEES